VSTSVDRALAAWKDWPLALSAAPSIKARSRAGRTNQSYRLDAPGLEGDLWLRLHRPGADQLGIDRDREREITLRTAEVGIGRPFWHWTVHYSIFPYLEARPWTPADFADADQRARLYPLIERLAGLALEEPRRCYSDYLLHYWRQLVSRSAIGPLLRREWDAFWPDLRAFDQADWPPVLVHHDLIPANVLDTGERLVVIDWEYASMGHADIDRWSLDPESVEDPFVGEIVDWLDRLWEHLTRL